MDKQKTSLASVLLSGLLLLFPACSSSGDTIPPKIEQEVVRVGEAAAAELMTQLKAHLQEALAQGDLTAAFEACAVLAQPLTDEVQETLSPGVSLKRASGRFRNPANAPDEWEARALAFFETQLAESGELPEHFCQHDRENGAYRYNRPLIVQKLCLRCHGSPDRMDPSVVSSLLENYPEDRAVGYGEGDFRGIIRVSIPEDAIAMERKP
jgi:hypothetical protein